MTKTKRSKIGWMSAVMLLGTLTGCIGYVDGPRAGVYVQPSVQVVVQDDYVYYPAYEVYYSSSQRQYIYLDGGAWVTRSSPSGISVDVLFASPSVRVGFHDAPSLHHASVVQAYPRSWAPPGQSRGNKEGNHGGNGNGGKWKN
jgi:hypothetical protein